ncbi:hypothetical protein F0919_12730 [Taibaiella lutea]|uniref:MORN repeat variant n=1 Tax=Taibaiella lutea TaxID=2608001 RepID=A0A5M6CHJ5_9BACT|nr:hypothetical protein [Taibaiella lutea]KAA5533402.1 hypothetical protein F0919_12730 [Taibaiella lutea]
MRSKFLLLGFCMLLSTFVKAQDTLTYFCNEGEQKTVKDSASFLRKAFFANGFWNVYDYYLTGQLKTIGSYNGKNEKQGHFVYYHENGNKFREGEYYLDYKIGNWKMWYDDNMLKANEKYSNDTALIGKIKKEGMALIKAFEQDVAMYYAGTKGVWVDTSQWFYSNGQIAEEEVWDYGLIKLTTWDSIGKKKIVNLKNVDWLKCIVAQPYYNGKVEKLIKDNNIKLSNEVTKRLLSYITFKVDANGKISDVRCNGKLCNTNATEFDLYEKMIANSYGNWIVGKRHNLASDFKTGFRVEGNIGSFSGWTFSMENNYYEY